MPALFALFAISQSVLPPSLIPKPVSTVLRSGEFSLNSESHIAVTNETSQLGEQLRGYLSPATGYTLNVGRRSGRNSISLRIDPRLRQWGPEAYRLDVEKDRVEIWGSQPAGVFYGIQTLRELFPADVFRKAQAKGATWSAPCLSIEDHPRFGWRGAHMDVARHFMPKSFVLKFLDQMALHKLNVFHWHLTDDSGWRIEIKQYPKLTEIGSLTDFSSVNQKAATRSASVLPGGFYTQDDIREVVKYAQDRFITILPEIEMPGHSQAAIRSYPELGNRPEIVAAGGDVTFLGKGDNVYNAEDSTIQFLQNVLTEVLGLFPGTFIHVGGDEVWKEPWKKNPRAQDRIRTAGLKNEDELQSWFIRQMDTFLTSKGRRLIGWDEILEGGLAPGAAVMSWRGLNGGITAARSGHDVVMAPSSDTYLDHAQSRDQSKEPVSIGGYLSLRHIYSYEPIPAGLTAEEAKHVLGAQAQLWSEYIPHPRHMEYMAFPRLCALSEVVWSPKEDRSYPEFLARLTPHLERLRIMDVFYREPRAEDLTPNEGAIVPPHRN